MKRFLILLAISASLAEQTKYNGYKVYHVYPENKMQVEHLRLLENDESYDFWSEIRNAVHKTDVMVAPLAQNIFEKYLRGLGMKYETMIEDVEINIAQERKMMAEKSKSNRVVFDNYNRHSEINDYLRELEKKYPDVVSLELIGKSYEGRDMIVIKISSGGSDNKPLILIDGGIHAREWISPATVIYTIEQMLSNPENRQMYEHVDWYIIPVLNPDGYEFSHENTRLWRKTRSPGIKCAGADANRNYDYYWGTIGMSTNECDITYRGKSAFSEVEVKNFALFAQKFAKNIKLHLSVHSYGQLLLYPWGYIDAPAPNGNEMQAVGDAVKDAIYKVNKTEYTVGYLYKTIYPNSGSSVDWFAGALDVPLSYTLELPDHGHGFVLPPSHILPIAQETFEGFKVFADLVHRKYSGTTNS